MEQELEKPSFMQKTRNYLRKKWVNAAAGLVLASALSMGAAPKISAQEPAPVQSAQQVARPEFNYNQVQENASFMGVTAGDHDFSRNLDFVLEDYSLGKGNEPFKLWVHEDFDFSNKKVLDEVKNRINNPDQYPMIEAIGKYSPMGPNGRFDGRLDLESIITRDIQGNEEIFYTDPADSNFYRIEQENFFDWAFFPGRHLTGFYYPNFYGGFVGPGWDWDMDGIPNWMDPFPFSADFWDPFIFDIGYGLNHWMNQGWFGWNYWHYWGNPDFYRNHHYDDWADVKRIINRDHLKDPHNRELFREYARRTNEARDITHVLSPNELKQVIGDRQVLLNREHQLARDNPTATIRQRDGSEVKARINAPEYRAPSGLAAPGEQRKPEYNSPNNPERRSVGGKSTEARIAQPRASDKSSGAKQTGKSTVSKGSTKSPPPSNKGGSGKTTTSGTVKKKKGDSESNYSPTNPGNNYSPKESYTAPGQRTTTTAYPSRIKQGDITDKLNSNTPRTIRNYTPPSRTTYAPRSNNTVRSPSTTRYSSPRNYSAPKYSSSRSTNRSSGTYKAPSNTRSSGSYKSPSKSSGSYKGSTRSSGSSYKGTTSRSSGSSGSVRKK